MKVFTIPVREDNYSYLIIDESTRTAAAVDPYDVAKVSSVAKDQGVRIVANLTTHHHFDHSGGNMAFASSFPKLPVYGGSAKIPALTNLVKNEDEFRIGQDILVRCLATPCHTQDSVCFYVTDSANNKSGVVFTGDTLFIGGCGRFFEGTGPEMISALTNVLGHLPDDTVVYCGHEYTEGNLAFARSIEPHNKSLDKLAAIIANNNITTGTTTIGDEKKWNVFMRLDEEAVRQGAQANSASTRAEVMDTLRELKNNFKELN